MQSNSLHYNKVNTSLSVSAEYVHSCRKSDPELNECIKQTLNHLRPYVLTGN